MQRLGAPELSPTEGMYHAALRNIRQHLMAVSLTLTDFDLPQPPAAIVHRNRLLYQERHGYDMSRLVATLEGYSSLNDDQRAVFDRVRASLDAYEAGTLSQVKLFMFFQMLSFHQLWLSC